MIQRVVLFKLKDEFANPKGRQEIIQHTVKTFQSIPGVLGVTVGQAGDDGTAGSWDISLMVYLAGPEAVEGYIKDPVHQDYVHNFMVPKISFKKAWNFEVPEGSIPHNPWASLPPGS